VTRLIALLGLAMTAAMVALALVPVPLVDRARDAVFDAYQRAAPRAYDPASPVHVIDIDEAALDAWGQWPWPRTTMAALTEARERLTTFRATTQIVDPGADLQGRMGLIAELQARLADELIRVDLLELRTGADDPRLNEGRQVTRAIEARIAAERRRLGAGGQEIDERDYARMLQEFSRLSVDVEIAEEAYASARAARDLARAEARRQSRYLAAHVRPTLAERPTAPRRPLVLAVAGFFLFLAWALAALVFYSLRDRRRA